MVWYFREYLDQRLESDKEVLWYRVFLAMKTSFDQSRRPTQAMISPIQTWIKTIHLADQIRANFVQSSRSVGPLQRSTLRLGVYRGDRCARVDLDSSRVIHTNDLIGCFVQVTVTSSLSFKNSSWIEWFRIRRSILRKTHPPLGRCWQLLPKSKQISQLASEKKTHQQEKSIKKWTRMVATAP